MSYETLLGCLFLFIILFGSLLVAFVWERRDSKRLLESERDSGDAMRDRFVDKIKRLRASVIEREALIEALINGRVEIPCQANEWTTIEGTTIEGTTIDAIS